MRVPIGPRDVCAPFESHEFFGIRLKWEVRDLAGVALTVQSAPSKPCESRIAGQGFQNMSPAGRFSSWTTGVLHLAATWAEDLLAGAGSTDERSALMVGQPARPCTSKWVRGSWNLPYGVGDGEGACHRPRQDRPDAKLRRRSAVRKADIRPCHWSSEASYWRVVPSTRCMPRPSSQPGMLPKHQCRF